MKTNETDPAQDAGKTPAKGVHLLCKVLVGGLKIGSHKKGRHAQIALPEAEAAALEKLGKVKVLGPALAETV